MSEFKAKINPFTGQMQLVSTNVVLAFKAAVASQASLPLTGNAKGDARLANDTGILYVWSIDASTGLLTDWVSSGDIIDLNWSAISGKPSSSVVDIDDAVSKKHSHSNKSILDDIEQALTSALKTAYDGAVTAKHTQGTDQGLDTGGVNAITASDLKTLKDTTVPAKADKVVGGTENNFAGLDSSGNLKDSGSKAGDFATVGHTHAQLHDAATAGDGISVIGQQVTNSDRGSTAVGTHEGTYTHSDIALNTSARHSHSNKTTLDAIQEAFTTALKNKLDGIESSAVSLATVKGDSDIADAISKKHAASGQFNQATAAEINGLTDKGTPVDADVILAEDSAAGTAFSKIKITWANIKATLKTYFDGLYDAVGAATSAINGHKDLSTGVHGVGAGTIAKTSDITKAAVGLSNVTDDTQVKASQLKRATFVNGDLSTGKLTITHNLGLSAPYSVIVVIFDNNSKQIIPDEVTGATNTVEIDLTSYGTLSGTWGYLLLG